MMKKLTVWLIVLMMAMAGLCVAALAEEVLLSSENEVAAPEAPIVSNPVISSSAQNSEPSAPANEQGEASGQEETLAQGSEEDPAEDPADLAEPDADEGDEESIEGPAEDGEEAVLEEQEEVQPERFEILYLYFDGSWDQEYVEYAYSNKALLPAAFVPERDGYAFAFWYVENGEVKPFEFGSYANGNLILRAFFTRDEEEGGEEASLPELKVTITCDAGADLKLGDTVTLSASLEGTEGWNYKTEWMYNDGSGWQAAPNGEGLTYQYVLDDSNNGWVWKMAVTVLIADGEAA